MTPRVTTPPPTNTKSYNDLKRMNTIKHTLMQKFYVKDENLAHLMAYLGEATAEIQHILSNYVDHSNAHVGTQNASGDDQLHLDIACDEALFCFLLADLPVFEPLLCFLFKIKLSHLYNLTNLH